MSKESELEDKQCNFDDPNTGIIFFSLKNMSKVSKMSSKLEGLSIDECKEYCVNVNNFNETSAFCGSFTYNELEKTCNIIYDNGYKTENDNFVIIENETFYEKSCINGLPKKCKYETIKLFTNRILSGYAENLTVAGSIEFCFEECLKNNAYCKSFLYFPKEKECILNSENNINKPEAFYEENNEDVLYGNNECYEKVKKITSDNVLSDNSFKIEEVNIVKEKIYTDKLPLKNTTTLSSIIQSTEKEQGTYKAEIINIYKDKLNENNSNDDIQLSISTTTSTINEKNVKKINFYPIPSQKKKDTYFSEWELWPTCISVGEKLIRKRKCINLKKCIGPLTQMKICKPEDVENYIPPKEVVDEMSGPIGPMRTIIPVSMYGSRELINGVGSPPSIYPNALPVGQRDILPDGAPSHPDIIWSPWSDNCQKFATQQLCENGLEVGFVSRECLAKNPKDCKGPFFRYCTLSC
ncbi:PAN-1 domain and Apple-like domain-containing protein [Strongyloides ratti]|uniref:PAN-1 domain and Apple-like domain-containing protein n=1 Tax=Strongyloides ratti TaxID=34506 RepID=A0A090KTL6_STRRB|nr:PAN-1 domain and Apple-like domain-containing protein [Strongyloides ratti]CEF60860.1 PAN-1 domain and Apple-like domain-containing protein [Strongyloides ratti]